MVEMGSERVAVEALQTGVHDYLIKDPQRGYPDLLAVTLQRAARTRGFAHRPTEEMLHTVEDRLKEIFEHTATGIYRTTPDGRILMANPALLTMLGYSSFEELSQKHMERVNKIVGFESRWKKRDGTTLIVSENARSIRERSGNILYYEETVEDITERKMAKQALRESEERLRHLRIQRRKVSRFGIRNSTWSGQTERH